MEMRFRAKRPTPCLSEFLLFPRDYHLVALVFAKDEKQAFKRTANHREGGEVHVIMLTDSMRSASMGDVFVSSDGIADFVTNDGFRILL